MARIVLIRTTIASIAQQDTLLEESPHLIAQVMKYIDADILRKEIEKRIKSSESCPFIEAEVGAEERREGKIRAYNEILGLIDSLRQEQQEDLEKAMYNKATSECDLIWNEMDYQIEAFVAGAEWQKAKMMEEAVEAKIYGYDDGSFELIASWLDMPKNSIYKDGQKVRIIIVKEDKE